MVCMREHRAILAILVGSRSSKTMARFGPALHKRKSLLKQGLEERERALQFFLMRSSSQAWGENSRGACLWLMKVEVNLLTVNEGLWAGWG